MMTWITLSPCLMDSMVCMKTQYTTACVRKLTGEMSMLYTITLFVKGDWLVWIILVLKMIIYVSQCYSFISMGSFYMTE